MAKNAFIQHSFLMMTTDFLSTYDGEERLRELSPHIPENRRRMTPSQIQQKDPRSFITVLKVRIY